MKLDQSEIEGIRKCGALLSESFVWSQSPQGVNYWSTVRDNLRELVYSAEKNSDCQAEIKALKEKIAELERKCC